MMSGSFCDLAEQTGRLFISEYFIQERKLPDAEFDHSAAGFRQNLQKPLPEPGYILSSGDGITVGESCQAFIIIAQQAVAIQHKEKQQIRIKANTISVTRAEVLKFAVSPSPVFTQNRYQSFSPTVPKETDRICLHN